jgi:hypothetical protein
MKLLSKIGLCMSAAIVTPIAVVGAFYFASLVGLVVVMPIRWFNDDLYNALVRFGPALGGFPLPLMLFAVGALAWWIGWRVANTRKRERKGKSLLQNFFADRKRWIIGLSLVALFLTGETVKNYINYDKRFHKANRLATGYVVEVDPGEPEGTEPSSHYEFKVNGVTYDGWAEDKLPEGEQILIRYNSSNPKFSHAQDDHRAFVNYNFYVFFLLVFVLAALAFFIRHRKPNVPYGFDETRSMTLPVEKAFPLPKDPPSRPDKKRTLLGLWRLRPGETLEQFKKRAVTALSETGYLKIGGIDTNKEP